MRKPSILNLCTVVRVALIAAGYSTTKAVNAVNGYLTSEENKLASETEKSSCKGISGRKNKVLKSRLVQTFDFEADASRPEALLLDFNAWMSEVEKTHSFEVTIPPVVCQWLDKFAKAEKPTAEPVSK